MPDKKSTRVAGHALVAEGAAHLRRMNGQWDRERGSQRRFGAGLCSCGEASDLLRSDSQRKQWHRAHKAEVQS